MPPRLFGRLDAAQRLLPWRVSQPGRTALAETLDNLIDGIDVSEHMKGDGDAASAGQHDVKKWRALAIEHGAITALGYGEKRLGRDGRFHTATGNEAGEFTLLGDHHLRA